MRSIRYSQSSLRFSILNCLPIYRLILGMAAFIWLVQADIPAHAEDWKSWRGPLQTGHSLDKSLPEKWSAKDVQWEARLKGEGQSCPVVLGDQVFLTQSEGRGKSRYVLCVDRNSGEIQWKQKAWEGEPEPSHKMNGWASATCATDGELLYAFFGKGGGLFCYGLDGGLQWNQPLGDFAGPWGTAACPVIVGDLVIQNCDCDDNAFIVAFNKKTGKQVWKTDRDNFRGWSTPILVKTAQRDELVLNGHSGVRAYNPKTGADLWVCRSFNGRGTPTVTPGFGLLYTVNGKQGDVYAIKPGGTGDVTETHMQWHTPRQCSRDLPSPILVGENLLVMDMRRATLTNYDAKTGQELWKKRVGSNSSGQFSATPVAWNGKAFFVAESGETFVVEPEKSQMKITAVNKVDSADTEIFRASLTPADGQVFLRSDQALYCIGNRGR